MATLNSAFQSGINTLYKAAGVAGIHIDSTGKRTAVTCLVEYDLSRYGDVAEIAQGTASIGIRVSELADPPRRADNIVVGSKTFVVGPVLSSDELEHTVLVS